MRRWALAALLIAASAGEARAQATTLLSENFDGANSWTVQGTSTTVTWQADGTPAGAPGGAFVSSPNSMNYNNGSTFDNGTTNSGSVTSPVIDLTGTTSGQLTFQCNFQTETPVANSWDVRRVQISNNNFTSTVFDQSLGQIGSSPLTGACSAMGTWHSHTIALSATWGQVRIRFFFNTLDPIANAYAGWFVDNVVVTAVIPPTPPVTPMTIEQVGSGTVQTPGWISYDGNVTFRANLTDPNPTDTVQLEVEVKVNGAAFDGLGTLLGNSVPASGGQSTASGSYGRGDFHWRARAVDNTGRQSPWIEFDPAPGPDFTVVLPGRDNENGNLGINDTHCSAGAGANGLALLAVLAALVVLRRR